jgi:hypothetical protein
MTVAAQLSIGARAKMEMAATGDREFRLAAMLPRQIAQLRPFDAPLTINLPRRR